MALTTPRTAAPAAPPVRPAASRRCDRLRILVGLNRLWIAGAELNAVDFADRFHRDGHHVVVTAQDEDDLAMADIARERGLTVRLLPRGRTHNVVRPLESLVRQEGIELLHMYYSKLTTAALLGPYRRWGVPVVTTEYGPGPVMTPSCSHLVVGTEECAAGMGPWFGAPVSSIEPPVDTERDRADAVDPGPFLASQGIDAHGGPRVVVVSRVDHREKLEGILATIDACTALADSGVTLLVVGGGDALAEVRLAAERANGRAGRRVVVVTGRLSDPRPAYAAADVVVGMGGSALRAMAFAKPVIVLGTNRFAMPFEPATAEYFFWRGFFGHGPVYDLTAALGRLTGDARLRRDLGEFGRHTVESRYSLDVAYRRLEQVYAAAIAQRPTTSDRWLSPARAAAGYTLAHFNAPSLWGTKFTQTPVAYS